MESGTRIQQLSCEQKLNNLTVYLDTHDKPSGLLTPTVALLTRASTHPNKINILAIGNRKRRGRNRFDRSHAPTM
jgi:hypothetical protein